MSPQYIPGVCNVGPAERAKRIRFGWTGLGLAVLLGGTFVFFNAPAVVRVIVFIPVFLSAIGFLQAYLHFCVAYGLMGIFNVSRSVGTTDTVSQAEFRALDKAKAWKVIAGAFAISASVSAFAVLVK